MRPLSILAPTLLSGLLLVGQAVAAPPAGVAGRLGADIAALSADAMEGRGPATAAEPKVIDYVVGQMKAAGLQPAGDSTPTGRAWTQAVPLARFQIKGTPAISVRAGGAALPLVQGEQIALRATETGARHVALKDAPVVFVGYGVKAPERGWDDFKGYDLKGKIALVLVNDPDYERGPDEADGGDFGGKAMTYYGRWTYKYEEAARQGAAGFIVIHETAPASYGWATVKSSNTGPVFDIVRQDPTRAHAPVEAWISRDAAVDLMRRAGLDFEALKRAARRRDFHPTPLPGVSFSADYDVDVQSVVSHNIAGVVTGAGHPDERVIYTAHWDHLGVGAPDARGDKIYNGAVDNGTGVAVVLELARRFAAGPRPDRSVMFLAVTAEEQGLLGSEYYAANPLYPLATTVADINMDALQPIGAARDIATAGEGGLTLQDELIAVARARGRSFTPDPNPEAGRFYRSDHFSLAKRGVPAISVGSGFALVAGGKAAGQALRDAYYRDRYHQPADEYGPDWNFDGIVADTDLLQDLGLRLANSRVWPSWKPGSEFKAARDASAALRK
jgi:Zn-dependent M28 family amino/carboxypeptidase